MSCLLLHISPLSLSLISAPSSILFPSLPLPLFSFLFFFNDTATTEIYTLSLHDALPICSCRRRLHGKRSVRGKSHRYSGCARTLPTCGRNLDRTRCRAGRRAHRDRLSK